MTINNFASAVAAAATHTDMTKAQTGGGGDYTPPPAGPCRLRFVGYVETGSHMNRGFQGAPDKVKPEAHLFFEVSGPKHPPVTGSDGVTRPAALVEIKLPVSLNEKAKFFALFNKMNYAGKARHIAELLGQPFKGVLTHREYTRKDGKPGVAVELKNAQGFTIEAPRVEDPDTGEYKTLTVAPAITPQRGFLWDFCTLEQWGSIYIEGEYAAVIAEDGTVTRPARSKNFLQERIKAAVNFPGSQIAQLLAGGEMLDLGQVEQVEATTQAHSDADDLLSALG
ncbi:hypothetical protein UFOVP60_36 [uncultured Caudovirales phage]|uniref:Uncharacterized protein n=1 Tax=uncultured Caudovirales phage TaxID=2100421 RepID=A0A6J5TA05_9CAUD|nr:hypothetical protein UFOVP60_36 [uncultured Caudovirales phage]